MSHEMKNLNQILIIICVVSLFCGCHASKAAWEDKISTSYSSKTFLYMGNQYVEKYNSKIDSLNYTWMDTFKENLHVRREYPKYHGEFRRVKIYEYYRNGEPKKTTIQTHYPRGVSVDSTVYTRIDSNTTVVSEFRTGENPFVEVRKNVNDTIFTDHIINGRYGYTKREFWETSTRKHDQIVNRELSDVLNVYVYNERQDLIRIERFESGEFEEISMSIEYEYDAYDRVRSKVTYGGDGMERSIISTEITVYID